MRARDWCARRRPVPTVSCRRYARGRRRICLLQTKGKHVLGAETGRPAAAGSLPAISWRFCRAPVDGAAADLERQPGCFVWTFRD